MASWNKMCRACLIIKESFTYVLSENVSPDLYYFCTSIEIFQDNLPKTLCDICYENLMKHSEFKRICLESQNALYNLNSAKDHDTASLTLDSNVEDDHQQKCEKVSGPITVKTEKVSGGYDYIYPVKSEDIDNEFYDSMDCCGNSFETNSRKVKKRKAKKLGKHKGKEKQKPRKHFSFTCETCNKKFNYLERFEAHKLEHQGKEPIIHCLPCNKTFMTWSGLRRHNDSEHTLVRLDKLKCKICGKICKSQQTLKMHQKIHGERKMYVCDVCGKGFTTKFILKAHLETHKENRERLFTCQHCGKKFYTNTILLSHISRRHTDRRFICQICSYPFTDKYNLAKHLLIHDGKKLYKCEICKKSYATQSSLIEHRRIHSGERPYICSYCPKSFLSKRRLDDHHKIHTGERPHKCVVCEQGFTQRGTLKRHMKVHDRSITILN